MRYLIFFLHIFYSSSSIKRFFNDNRIYIESVSTIGYIQLIDDNSVVLDNSSANDKKLKFIYKKMLLKCSSHGDVLINKFQGNKIRNETCAENNIYFFDRLIEEFNNSIENIKRDIDGIFNDDSVYISTFIMFDWFSSTQTYINSTKKLYNEILKLEISKISTGNLEEIYDFMLVLLNSFTRDYLKKAMFKLSLFFQDRKVILEILEARWSHISNKRESSVFSNKKWCVYNLIYQLSKEIIEDVKVKEKLLSENNIRNVKEIFKIIFDSDEDVNIRISEMLESGVPKESHFLKHFSLAFKSGGNIRNLIPSFEKYLESLKSMVFSHDKFHLLFVEIDLNNEVNAIFKNKKNEYLIDFKNTLLKFTEVCNNFKFSSNIKIVFIWKEIILREDSVSINSIFKEKKIGLIELRFKRFVKKLSDICDLQNYLLQKSIIYARVNESDKNISDGSPESCGKLFKFIFLN